MARYLLDTRVLLDLLRGEADTVAALRLLGEDDAKLVSALTVAELHACLGEMEPDEERPVRILLSALETIPVDSDIARRAAAYRVRWGPSRGISLRDALLAATAAAAGATLVTPDAAAYPIPGLPVTTPAGLTQALAPPA